MFVHSGFVRILLSFSSCSVDTEYCKTPACVIFILTLFSTIWLTESLLTCEDCLPGMLESSEEDASTLLVSGSSRASSFTSSGFVSFSIFFVTASFFLIVGRKGKFLSLTADSKACCFSKSFLTMYGSDRSDDFFLNWNFGESLSEDGALFFPISTDVGVSFLKLFSVFPHVRGFKSFSWVEYIPNPLSTTEESITSFSGRADSIIIWSTSSLASRTIFPTSL